MISVKSSSGLNWINNCQFYIQCISFLYYRLYLQLFIDERMSYLRYLCLLAYSGVLHILCCGFFLHLVYTMLTVSLIAPSVFSNIYLVHFQSKISWNQIMLLTTSDLISNTHNMLSCITLMTDVVCCFLLKCNEMGEKQKNTMLSDQFLNQSQTS
jgi:hypothetical protein